MTVVNKIVKNRVAPPSLAVPVQGSPPNVEALPGLGWSDAVELPRAANLATNPAEARRAWVHRAPEGQVLKLYLASCVGHRAPASPWWLRALAVDALPSREAGFRIEDAVGELLRLRQGWVYVPWGHDGESGYWEFTPSEQLAANPTTLVHTDRHTGWIDILPAHSDAAPKPIAVAGLAELSARIEAFEAIR